MGKMAKVIIALAAVSGVVAAVVLFRPRAVYTFDRGKHKKFEWESGIDASPHWKLYFDYLASQPYLKKPYLHFSMSSSLVSGLEYHNVMRWVLTATSPQNGIVLAEGTLDSKPVGIDENKIKEIATLAARNAMARRLSGDAGFASTFNGWMPGKSAAFPEVAFFVGICEQAGRSAKPVLPKLLGLLEHREVASTAPLARRSGAARESPAAYSPTTIPSSCWRTAWR